MKIVKNVKIWKWLDKALPSPEGQAEEGWLIISNLGRIESISTSSSEPPPSSSDNMKVIDGKGQLLLPGLIDSHIHVCMSGESSYFVDLKKCDGIISMQNAINEHLRKYPSLTFIQGVNWAQDRLGEYPTRQCLDTCSESVPIYLWRECWHIGCLRF